MGKFSYDMNIYAAEQFIESVSEPSANSIYISFGRAQPWSNEASPDTAETYVYSKNDIWRGMIGAKRVTGTDIKHVIPRNNWEANTVYDPWDYSKYNNEGESNVNFYVVNSDWSVYKCIGNNNNANSTIEPTQITTSLISTEDGYKWKYMYTVSDYDRTFFSTNDYIPVKKLSDDNNSTQWDVQNTAISGAISSIRITDGGSDYNDSNVVTVTITGDGTGATATATLNTVSNTVKSITVTNSGSGYTNAVCTITTPSSANGVGATANVMIGYPGGHGSDPLYELGGKHVMITARFSPTRHPILSTNTIFRQVAVIKDPLTYGTTNVSTNTAVSQLVEVTVSGETGDYQAGEYVYQGPNTANPTFIGLVNDWDSANSILKLTNVEGEGSTDSILGATSYVTGFATSFSNPELKLFSGKILYINNMIAVTRDADQTEEIKLILSF